uniref:Amino acid transporter n=1 Tax=Mastacembelus armatus TaxID=205130 RepID=A0A3Q3L9Y9_9TELE
MEEIQPSSNDLDELDSVEATEPQETQTRHKYNKPSADVPSSQNGSNIVAFLKRNAFVVLTVIAVALGIGLGFVLRHINMSPSDIQYLTFPGELLLRILQMLALPLIVSSLISGMSSVDTKAYGKIGMRAFGYYLVTTMTAAFTGIALALLIQPGNSSRNTSVSSGGKTGTVQPVDSFLDLLRNMIPSNLVEACFRKVWSTMADLIFCLYLPGTSNGVNFFGLLVFCVAFGLILGNMETEGKPLKDFFDSLNKAIMQFVSIVIWYSPVGILFLLAGQIVKMIDIGEIGHEVAMYAVTVITGLVIHSLFTLPLIYFIVTRKNPYRFMSGILQAITTAFGTSSR